MTPNTNSTKNTTPTGWSMIKHTIKIMMMPIRDRTIRNIFHKRLTESLNIMNVRERTMSMRKILKDIEQYLESGAKWISGEKTYEKTPTFDQAVLDYLNILCPDLYRIPEMDEYYAQAEAAGAGFGGGLGGIWNIRHGNGGKEELKTIVKKGNILASAPTQSGKSTFIKCQAAKLLISGVTPIIITRNITGDANQLHHHFEQLVEGINEYLTKNKVEKKFQLSLIRGDKLGAVSTCQSLVDSLEGKSSAVVIGLANETQLNNIHNIVRKHTGKFDLFLDEHDGIDYGTDKNGELCGTAEALKKLKELSRQTISVTATPFDVIFSEEELKSVNQLRLTPHPDYRGFGDILVKPLDIDVHALNQPSSYQEQLAHDPNLLPFLQYFSKIRPDFAWRLKKKIPNICLIKNTRFVANQIELARGVTNQFQIPTVVYNGSGVMINHSGMKATVINGKNVIPNEFTNLDIADALQYFHDNGGLLRFPRIVVVAGDLAGRSISYVTRNYDWHVTDMYYIPAKNTCIAEMIQSAGRLCGRNKHLSHLHLHATMKVAEALYSGFNFMDETIARAIAEPLKLDEEEASFAESLQTVLINKRKMPKGRELTTKVKVRKTDFNLTNKVTDSDGGRNINTYKYKTVAEHQKELHDFLVENHPDEFGPNNVEKDAELTMPQEDHSLYNIRNVNFEVLNDMLATIYTRMESECTHDQEYLRGNLLNVMVEKYGYQYYTLARRMSDMASNSKNVGNFQHGLNIYTRKSDNKVNKTIYVRFV